MIFDNGHSSVNGLLPQFSGKESTCNTGDAGLDSLGGGRGEDPLEEGMATHSSISAWRIPRTEQTGSLHSQGRKEWNMFEVTEHTQLCEHYPKQNLEHLHHPGKSPIDLFNKPDLLEANSILFSSAKISLCSSWILHRENHVVCAHLGLVFILSITFMRIIHILCL